METTSATLETVWDVVVAAGIAGGSNG
jgi:hypothetical protein